MSRWSKKKLSRVAMNLLLSLAVLFVLSFFVEWIDKRFLVALAVVEGVVLGVIWLRVRHRQDGEIPKS